MSLDINETRCGICQDLDSKNDSFTFEAAAVARSAKGGCATCDILSRGLVHARPDFLREVGKVKAEKAKDKPMTLSFLIKGSPSQESVDIYSHAESPTPYPWIGPGEEVSIDSSSDECFRLAERWIQDCAKNHPKCLLDRSPELPTRVVHVGSANQPPRLYIPQNERAEYLALSHCWGPPAKAAVTVKTTAATLQQFQTEIAWAALSTTFRDAITITRRLGIQYLWIDSLCIIQGDAKDWEIEAAKMTTVYANAFIMIAASGASDGDGGCFIRDRDASAEGVLQMKCKGPTNTKSFVYARRSRRGIHFTLAEMRGGEYAHGWKTALGQPLETRAWTFQEEQLATRILFYTEDELQWRCSTVSACECRGSRPLSAPKHHELRQSWLNSGNAGTSAPSSREGVIDWYWMVSEYTRRDMTYSSDRLPGISGIAQLWEKAEGDTYHAGLWERDLAHHLLWWTHAVGLGARARDSTRHPAYYAPTWSWASITGSVQHLREPGEIRVPIIDVVTEPATSNRFGPVKRGILSLRGFLAPVKLALTPSSPFGSAGMVNVSDARPGREDTTLGSMIPDVQSITGGLEIDIRDDHFLLPVACTQNAMPCLVLRQSRSNPLAFERVGFQLLMSSWELITSSLVERQIVLL